MLVPLQSYPVAWWTMVGVSLVAWLGSIAVLLVELRQHLWWPLRPEWWPLLLAGLVLFPPVRFHLRFGQVALLLLGALTLAWALMRRERELAAGVVLGLSLALKP